ncbi:amidase [Kibdelosporangium banguiense]|uniref:Amidase n=1 Tax=Kibdelosporangium banguiense TaxID=1365924 RepID=A0ABS4TVY7_9PSEU|nr:amidase [Kibdelosporangium banguiense]MBP2328557.1 amidase [Kibdelosporangium banguiense]
MSNVVWDDRDDDEAAMSNDRIHAFGDDVLADHDAVAIAELVRTREVGVAEVTAAAIARAERVGSLNAVVFDAYEAPRSTSDPGAPLYGVPTYIKDNTDVAGMPSNHGTDAYVARPAEKDGPYTEHFLATGVTVLGKTALPEYGFSASTEFQSREPVGNPWQPEYSVGASSGGAAVLVAAGVVPIAHANDGGGSIRIPAACAGLIGLKPTRGRHVDGPSARQMPINVVSEGVLTRSVRDTAAFVAAMEDRWRNPALPPIGLVTGPARRRLRVGLITESATGASACSQTKAAVEATAILLEQQGHIVEPVAVPFGRQFVDDFVLYWGLLATAAAHTGKLTDRAYNRHKLDGFTQGLRRRYLRTLHHTPGAIRRLTRAHRRYAGMFSHHELILSPVLLHTTPKLGYLSPTVPFDELLERLTGYAGFTPLSNIVGAPAISLPMAVSEEGLPIGVQLAAAHGDERTLLETAFAIEQTHPWPRIQES